MNEKKSKIAKWSLIFGIVILLNLFINISLDLIYQSPSYNDFCSNELRYPQAEVSEEEMQKNYEEQQKCSDEYQSARESFEKNVFITLIAIGVVIYLVSLIGKLNYVLSTSLSFAAVLNFIIASMRYWSSANEFFKLIILGIALAILIGIGIKKFKD